MLNLAMVVLSALIIWKSAMVYTISESPVVVVLRCVHAVPHAHRPACTCPPPRSGSMEPAFQRGDILFLDNQPTRINAGEIVVYNVKGRDVPIVHRVLETHELYVPARRARPPPASTRLACAAPGNPCATSRKETTTAWTTAACTRTASGG